MTDKKSIEQILLLDENRGTKGNWYAEITDNTIWIGTKQANAAKVHNIACSIDYCSEYTVDSQMSRVNDARFIAESGRMAEILRNLHNLQPTLEISDKIFDYLTKGKQEGELATKAFCRGAIAVIIEEIQK